MKISMIATNESVQFNLEAESKHEKKFMQMLSDYDGEVTISQGVDIALAKGGYLRNFGDSKDITAVRIEQPKPKEDSTGKQTEG